MSEPSFENEERVKVVIFGLDKSTADEFKEWCNAYANRKYNSGLKLLLYLAKVNETNAFLSNEIHDLKERLKELETTDETIVSSVKTFGGEI